MDPHDISRHWQAVSQLGGSLPNARFPAASQQALSRAGTSPPAWLGAPPAPRLGRTESMAENAGSMSITAHHVGQASLYRGSGTSFHSQEGGPLRGSLNHDESQEWSGPPGSLQPRVQQLPPHQRFPRKEQMQSGYPFSVNMQRPGNLEPCQQSPSATGLTASHTSSFLAEAADVESPSTSDAAATNASQSPSGSDSQKAGRSDKPSSVTRQKSKRTDTSLDPLDQTARSKAYKDSAGVLQGTESVFGARQNHRRKLTPEKKAQNQFTKPPSCTYCKKLRKECKFTIFRDSFHLCDRCILSNSLKLHLGCHHPKIVEAVLFRTGPAEDDANHPLRCAGQLTGHIDRLWSLTEAVPARGIRELMLTQDAGIYLTVKVAPFVAKPGDKTAYTWKDSYGQDQSLEMPWYSIATIDNAKSQLEDYVQRSMYLYLDKYVDTSDPIAFSTFEIAQRLAERSPLIRMSLLLWSSSRMIEETWRLCGVDNLGMDPAPSGSPWAGIIPVTPIMDQQLDQFIIRFVLRPLREWVLRHLTYGFQAIAKDKTKKSPLEVFICCFILLHNCAVQLGASRRFAQRYGMDGRYGPRGKYNVAQHKFNTARIILMHFHTILRGASLFSLSSSPSVHSGFDGEQLQYLENLRDQISCRRSALLQLQSDDKYEHALYFVTQMFFEEWDARPRSIAELPAFHDQG